MEQQGLQGPRIALLIDFDNVILGVDEPPGFDVELVVNALRSRGVVVLGRAYGDWYRHNRHRRKLMEQGIELVETPAFGPIIKNSADIRIALDAFEIGMTQNHISHFCLVSGDSDFLPLVKRLQLLGKTVIVIAGNKFTSELIRRNCNEYVSYENLLAESVGATEDATTLEGAYALLNRTVNTMNERGQDARSSAVKQMMLQLNPVFSERSFGCSQFKQFLNKACGAGIIRLGNRDGDSGEYHVRLIDDNGNTADEPTETIAPEKPLISDLETAPVRSRNKSTSAKSAPEPETTSDDDSINLAEEIANNASTVSPSRRGRLRFSGRTWRSSGTSTKAVENADDNATEESPVTPLSVDAEVVPEEKAATESDASNEVVATEQTKTSTSKRTGRKSTKATTTKKAEKSQDSETESKEISTEAASESPAEESVSEEEKPKKKAPARRRTSSRTTTSKTRTAKAKKTDNDTEATPAATEEASAQAESVSEDVTAEVKTAEDSASETSKEAPEAAKPKKKAPVRRRTSSRTTKKKDDEKATEATDPTEAKAD